MPRSLAFVLLALALVGLASLVVRPLLRSWLRYRGTRVVVCPASRKFVAVEVEAGRAALAAARGGHDVRLGSCTLWPERAGCGQECLAQIEAAPESCLVRAILADWYAARACVLCGRGFERVRWHDHRPGLRALDGTILGWDDFRPEQVIGVLASHEPVCWDCAVAEGFRLRHPELVTDRAPRLGLPPSMS